MDSRPTYAIILISFLVSVFLAGCGGLPSDLRHRAENLPSAIESARSAIQKESKKFRDYLAGRDRLERAVQGEDLERYFTESRRAIRKAAERRETELIPLLKENREEAAGKVGNLLTEIEGTLAGARETAAYPVKRLVAVQRVMENMKSVHEKAVEQGRRIDGMVEDLRVRHIEKAKEKFPDASDRIDTRTAPLFGLREQAEEARLVVKRVYEAHRTGKTADYPGFADSADLIAKNHDKAEEMVRQLEKDLEGLSQSYTKILSDMKVEYFVKIKREAWDNSSDYYRPYFAEYVRNVPADVYEEVTASNADEIAKLTTGFFGASLHNKIGGLWDRLEIDPAEEWPGGRVDTAVFWFEDWYGKYFHKYIIVEGEEKTETDWEQVDEDTYADNIDYLGMALVTKPYGVFEDDAYKQAAPPGMGFVGNPEYGKWDTNQEGERFWVWYGKYRLFSDLILGPATGMFLFSDWNRWNRHHRYQKPYFGKTTTGARKYGTRGTYVRRSTLFRNSSFARRGGLKTQMPSMRGAGASFRGGGPGSRGK